MYTKNILPIKTILNIRFNKPACPKSPLPGRNFILNLNILLPGTAPHFRLTGPPPCPPPAAPPPPQTWLAGRPQKAFVMT